MIAATPLRAWMEPETDPCDLTDAFARQPGESEEHRSDRVDTELMTRFRDSGDANAFDALYRHSRARVFAWLRWVLREQHVRLDPVELLQDTFVNVYRYASSFRSEHATSFRSWVRTIAANVVRRARATNAQRAQSDVDARWAEPVDWHAGPQRRVSEGEESVHLHTAWLLFLEHYARAFAHLSPRDRRALELVELEGRSYAETSEILRVGPSNMKMIMLRARRRLIAHMRAAMGGSETQVEITPARPHRLSA